MKIIAIIPAAGKGVRSGFPAPKQYLKFYGKELIVYTLEVFQKSKLIDEIIVVSESSYIPLLKRIKKKYELTKINKIVAGGESRQDSVYNALLSLTAEKNDLIVVHDAARPLLPAGTLAKAILTAQEKGNALVCIKAKDTLIKGSTIVKSYLNREEIYNVQTPQIFKYNCLMNAFKKAYNENFYGTDESVLIKRLGKRIFITEGSMLNFKVTTKSDLSLFKELIKN
jgi:2-C-methyl-D-erythritol 4-phosphate cytidylyltransferase